MPGMSLTQKQLTAKYLDGLAAKVFRRIADNILGNTLASDFNKDAARERTYNQLIARHLREARDREARGEPLTEVQEKARNWRKIEERNDVEIFSRLQNNPEDYSDVNRERIRRIIFNRALAHIEADRAEENRDLPPYTIPAPPYRGRKTKWRTFKSKMTKTFFGSRKKTSSPAPLYYPPRYSDIEVGGRRKKSRRKTRKLRRS